jgi:hypothetical protein
MSTKRKIPTWIVVSLGFAAFVAAMPLLAAPRAVTSTYRDGVGGVTIVDASTNGVNQGADSAITMTTSGPNRYLFRISGLPDPGDSAVKGMHAHFHITKNMSGYGNIECNRVINPYPWTESSVNATTTDGTHNWYAPAADSSSFGAFDGLPYDTTNSSVEFDRTGDGPVKQLYGALSGDEIVIPLTDWENMKLAGVIDSLDFILVPTEGVVLRIATTEAVLNPPYITRETVAPEASTLPRRHIGASDIGVW